MSKVIQAMGIDLTDEYAQISYILEGETQVSSLTVNPEEQSYIIPALLYYREDNDCWYVGDEAVFNSETDKKTAYSFDRDIKNDTAKMTKYLELLIKLAKKILEADLKGSICIACEDGGFDETVCIYSAMKKLGYRSDEVKVINHDEAFIYYTINQKKELWVNDVILFDFTKNHFKYRRFHETKGGTPSVITVSCEDLSGELGFWLLNTEVGRLKADRIFKDIIAGEVKKYIVCTAYLTGTGFYRPWGEEAINTLCERRKVFKGYNLYVKGACFAAHKKYEAYAAEKYIFRCNGRTRADVGLKINNQGKDMVISLSQAGTNWYEAGAAVECITDDTMSADFVILSKEDGGLYNKSISLESLPKRPNKTTRLKITLSYKNDREFEIIIRDMGFGELFRTSGTVIKETINLEDLV